MTSPEPVTRIDHRDSVATITLLREPALNAFDDALAMEFRSLLKHLSRDAETRVIVITGSGNAFSAGQDVFELAHEESVRGPRAAGDQLRQRFLPLIMLLHEIEKPVIAQINGVAAGAGLAIAIACDFRVAAENATLIMSPIAIGLIPGSGLTAMVPGMVGIGQATELFMLGKRIDATRAVELGLIHSAVPADQLSEKTHELASQLASQPPLMLALTKRALNRSLYTGLEAHMQYEAYLQELAAGTPEHREALARMTSRKAREANG